MCKWLARYAAETDDIQWSWKDMGASLDWLKLTNIRGFKNLKLQKLPEIICEPGRSLVAESGSTIVRVNLRKKWSL